MKRTHCRSGQHELKGENVYVDGNGNRHCRACRTAACRRRDKATVTISCSQCGRDRTVRVRALEARNDRPRRYPIDWCQSCVNKDLALTRRPKRPVLQVVVGEKPGDLFNDLMAEAADWRTPEEREDKHEYWRSRYTPAEIHRLAASLHEVLDTGGSAARKYRLVHNRKRRAA